MGALSIKRALGRFRRRRTPELLNAYRKLQFQSLCYVSVRDSRWTVEELSELLDVTEQTIRKLIRDELETLNQEKRYQCASAVKKESSGLS